MSTLAIWINYEPETEEQDLVAGARIIDVEEHGCWVMADVADIDAQYSINGGVYRDEFWGQVAMIEEIEYTVHKCNWMGYKIINAEEVVETLEAMYV